MAKLLILSGKREGDVIELTQEKQLIGSRKTAEIPIRDRCISFKHATIYYEDNQYWLEDLGSRTGTFGTC